MLQALISYLWLNLSGPSHCRTHTWLLEYLIVMKRFGFLRLGYKDDARDRASKDRTFDTSDLNLDDYDSYNAVTSYSGFTTAFAYWIAANSVLVIVLQTTK